LKAFAVSKGRAYNYFGLFPSSVLKFCGLKLTNQNYCVFVAETGAVGVQQL